MEHEFDSMLAQDQTVVMDAFNSVAQVAYGVELLGLLALLLIAVYLSRAEREPAAPGFAHPGRRGGKRMTARVALTVLAVFVLVPLFF